MTEGWVLLVAWIVLGVVISAMASYAIVTETHRWRPVGDTVMAVLTVFFWPVLIFYQGMEDHRGGRHR